MNFRFLWAVAGIIRGLHEQAALSLARDLRLILLTVAPLFRGRGAY